MWYLKCSFSPSLSVDTSIRVLFSCSTSEVIDWSLSCSSLFVFLAAPISAQWEAFNFCSWKWRKANNGNFKTHSNNDAISYLSPRKHSPFTCFPTEEGRSEGLVTEKHCATCSVFCSGILQPSRCLLTWFFIWRALSWSHSNHYVQGSRWFKFLCRYCVTHLHLLLVVHFLQLFWQPKSPLFGLLLSL